MCSSYIGLRSAPALKSWWETITRLLVWIRSGPFFNAPLIQSHISIQYHCSSIAHLSWAPPPSLLVPVLERVHWQSGSMTKSEVQLDSWSRIVEWNHSLPAVHSSSSYRSSFASQKLLQMHLLWNGFVSNQSRKFPIILRREMRLCLHVAFYVDSKCSVALYSCFSGLDADRLYSVHCSSWVVQTGAFSKMSRPPDFQFP